MRYRYEKTIASAIRRIPGLGHRAVGDVRSLSDGGNRVLRATLQDETVVVRMPGRRRYIDTVSEWRNQCAAATLGLSPRVYGHDPQTGALVLAWADGFRPATPADFAVDQRFFTLARILARLHHETSPFRDRVTLAQSLSWNLSGRAGGDPRVTLLARAAADRLAAAPAVAPVNCHGDPTLANVLCRDDNPGALLLIDWEFSHQGSAAWDLSIACDSIGAGPTRQATFVERYNRETAIHGAAAVPRAWFELVGAVTALISAAWMINHGIDGDLARLLERARATLVS